MIKDVTIGAIRVLALKKGVKSSINIDHCYIYSLKSGKTTPVKHYTLSGTDWRVLAEGQRGNRRVVQILSRVV